MDSPNSIEQRQQTIENLDEEQYLQQSTIDDTVNDDIKYHIELNIRLNITPSIRTNRNFDIRRILY